MKPCPFCAEEIQDAAIKCKHCGSMLVAQPPVLPTGLTVVPSTGPTAPTQASRREAKVLFEGHPSVHAWLVPMSGAVVMSILGMVLAGYLLIAFWSTQPLYALFGVVLAIGGIGWYFVLQLQRRSTYIRISDQTIDVETGILGRRIETVQLWRVRDIDFSQSAVERLFGVARIHVLSHDQGQPDFQLRGLPGSRQLFTDLRDAIAIARQSRNVLGVVD